MSSENRQEPAALTLPLEHALAERLLADREARLATELLDTRLANDAKPLRDPARHREPLRLALLGKLERKRANMECTKHPGCGPVTRAGTSGHGHGPSPSTGLWCWHFDSRWIGRPDEIPPEGSNLARRRAQEAEWNGGDPFAHKVYPEAE